MSGVTTTGNNGQVMYPVRPVFADARASVGWERAYPFVLLAYYGTCSEVSRNGSTCDGGCGGSRNVREEGNGTQGSSCFGTRAWSDLLQALRGAVGVSGVGSTGIDGVNDVFGGNTGAYESTGLGAPRSSVRTDLSGEDGCVGVGCGDVEAVDCGGKTQSEGLGIGFDEVGSGGEFNDRFRPGDDRSARGDSNHVVGKCDDGVGLLKAIVVEKDESSRGKNYGRNSAAKRRRKAKLADYNRVVRDQGLVSAKVSGVDSENWRSKDSVVSSASSSGGGGKCWTVKEETGMEKRIREALERKKAVEAELAARKAELALKRMNDTVLTELYDNRVKQEGICKMNQAIVKSEKSLENLKSVSPGSSATPGEIREALLNSEKWKHKEKKIRAWVASGHADSGIVEILDGEEDDESLDDFMRMFAVEGQDEIERQAVENRKWKNAYKTDDEIVAQENKIKAQYDARVLGKVAGKRVSGKAARDEEAEFRKAQFAHDLGVARIKDLEAQMLRSC